MENVREYLKNVSYEQFVIDMENGKFTPEQIFFNSDTICNYKDSFLNSFSNGEFRLHPYRNEKYKEFLEKKLILEIVGWDLTHKDFVVEKSYTELLINVWYKQNVCLEIRPDGVVTEDGVTYLLNSKHCVTDFLLEIMNFIIYNQTSDLPIKVKNHPYELIILSNGVGGDISVTETHQLCNELFGFSEDDIDNTFGSVGDNKLIGGTHMNKKVYEFEYFPTNDVEELKVKEIDGYRLFEHFNKVEETYHGVHSFGYMKKIIGKFKNKCK